MLNMKDTIANIYLKIKIQDISLSFLLYKRNLKTLSAFSVVYILKFQTTDFRRKITLETLKM